MKGYSEICKQSRRVLTDISFSGYLDEEMIVTCREYFANINVGVIKKPWDGHRYNFARYIQNIESLLLKMNY